METFRRYIIHHVNNRTDTHLLTSRWLLLWIKMTRIYWKRGNSIWHSVWRFTLEIQAGGESCMVDDYKHENILSKTVFLIHWSQWMLAVQPNYCGTCNTAKSCTDYSTNIWNIQSKTLIINMRHMLHYHWKLYKLLHFSSNAHSFVFRCYYLKLQCAW